MKVLLLTARPYLPQQIGGREMVIHETAVALQRLGHDPIVMSSLQPGNWMFYKNRLRSRLTGRDYHVDHLLGYPIYRGWSWQRGLPEILGKHRPDMALVESTSLEYLQAFRELGIPAALRLHDCALHTLGGDPSQFLATQFIAVSSFLAQRFEDKFALRPLVLPPLIDATRCATETSRKKIVFINPRRVKGGDIALAVAANCPDIPFLFFEAWTEDDEVRALRTQAKRLKNVEWRPSVMDAKALYREAHTVLIPSCADETWGRVASEAHFSGIPVIASRRGGLVESVGPGGILLDPQSDAEQWTQAVRRVWDDRALYAALSRAALDYSRRQELSAQWNIESLLQNLEGVARQMGQADHPGAST